MTTTPDKPRQRRVNGEASRLKILQAATEIAAERGYEGTSIGLVSERSGLPASSIYWHFKDKDALIAAVIDHSFETWLSNAGIGPELPEGPIDDQLKAMMQGTAKALRESSDFLRLGLMLTLERRPEEPTARRRFLAVRDATLTRTIATFARLFPDLDESALRTLATFTMATADGLFIVSEIDGDGADITAEFDMLASAIHGAVTHLRNR
ncbi:TetR/AcrR family transcriptional regulator [Mycobacterium vicinigordonae]|uniref:TetR/AcrR family transcriptional regulator n=1 Tax=Mycobacterium vicinigordonae TaxID=1719132 RepID=A0A7D6I5N0_9MYCO|nr:TetR/AcrR family transcriptional regulator [Mycobacterium vicinigordonae]QLL07538.1 TetR/AcrR family transcriptional regulator [Mycobacterium vicinigordonae]